MTTALVVIVVAVVLLLLTGVRLPEGNQGGRMFHDRLKQDHGILREPAIIIPFIDSTESYSVRDRSTEYPAEPEYVDEENRNAAPGQYEPWRVAHKGLLEADFYVEKQPGDASIRPNDPLSAYRKVRYDDLDPAVKAGMMHELLHDPLTSNVSFVWEWRIIDTDEDARNYRKTIDPANGRKREEEVDKRGADLIEASLQELLKPLTLGHAQDRKGLFSKLVEHRIKVMTGEIEDPATGQKRRSWGIATSRAEIKRIAEPKRVAEARANAAAARGNKQAAILDAEGRKQATILEAEGQAALIFKDAEARANGLKKMAEVLKTEGGRLSRQMDVAGEAARNAGLILMPTDIGPFASILSLATKMMGNQPGGEASPANPPSPQPAGPPRQEIPPAT